MPEPSRPPVTEKELREKLDELIARIDKNIEEMQGSADRTEKAIDKVKEQRLKTEDAMARMEEALATMKAKSIETLTFRADPAFIDAIQKLADEDGVTRAEIVRRAIGLYSYASSLAAQDLVLKPATPTTGDPPC